MIGGHIDALTARLKPVSTKKTKAGYVQLGVAPYAGALNSTWWDRDLGVGGRVLVKDEKTGKISSNLVKLGHPSKSRCIMLIFHTNIYSCPHPNSSTSFWCWNNGK